MPTRERFVIALLCAVVLLAPPVVAQTEVNVPGRISETVDVAAGEWRAYRITVGSMDSVAFSATVTAGAAIDVYLLTSRGYDQYRNPSEPTFEYWDPGTEEITTSFAPTVSPPAGTYYLVLDNAQISQSGASGSGDVTVSMSAEVRPFPILTAVLGGVAVLAIIILLIALVVRRRRKRRAMMPAMAPMQPPMQPPYQPPSNPPPGP